MKTMKQGLALLGAIALIGAAPMAAWANAPAPPEKPGKQDKADQSFKGKVEKLDVSARTFTVGGKLIYTADTTKITKDGRMITVSDMKVGDEVSGTTHQTFDGKTEAVTVVVASDQKDKQEEPLPY